ncbi:MAG: hypothetical protein MUE61_14850 [Vicinamibacterales bacterium]|jgi:hypothetical protein|nr:hypothetical protein [Vicinamibacterales bacterium]
MTSQAAEDSAVTLPKQAGAWIRSDEPRRITEETIFDYMDGAGELYLAYRFGHLDVYVYAAPEKALGEIRVELYRMRSPDDAFGLLSVDWGGEPVDLTARGAAREDAVPAVPSHDALYGGGLLRFRSGSLYGRVMASRESPASREQVLAIAQSIVKDRPANGRPPGILSTLPGRLGGRFVLRPDRTCFFRSHYVLNSVHYLAPDDVLGLGPAVDAVIGEYRSAPQGGGPVRLIGITYPTPAAAAAGMAAFLESLSPGSRAVGAGRLAPSAARGEGGWLGWAAQDRYLAIVLGAPGEEEAQDMAGAAMVSLSRQ